MSGRVKFKKYRLYIEVLEKVSMIVPKFVLTFLWNITDSYENTLSLLIRYIFIKKYSHNCGNNIFIGKNVTIKNFEKMNLGSNISIHAYSYIDAYGEIDIGSNVSIANHSSLISFEHTWEDKNTPIKYNETKPGKITISEDVWIGSGCRILSNVTIGERCIAAAGAVVNKNIPPNCIVGGVPCKKLKEIN